MPISRYLILSFFALLLSQALIASPVYSSTSVSSEIVLKEGKKAQKHKQAKKKKRPLPRREWSIFWISIFILGVLLFAGIIIGLAYLAKAALGIGLGFGFLLIGGLFLGIFLLWRLIRHIKKKKKEKRLQESYE